MVAVAVEKKILVVEPGASARVSSYVDLSNPSERGEDELEELWWLEETCKGSVSMYGWALQSRQAQR